MVWLLLPETLRERAPEPVSIAWTLRSYRRFLADRGFVIHLGIATCSCAGLFAWKSSGAFVLQDIYGLSRDGFRPGFTIAGSGYLVGTSIAARFVMRWGSPRTMGLGAAAMALGGPRDGAAGGVRRRMARGASLRPAGSTSSAWA